MKLCKSIFLGSMLWCTVSAAQNDSINRLEEVIVVADKIQTEVVGLKETKVSEEQKQRNSSNLTEVLRYNSSIVFRDYGNGGISTASFRGTSATNTQVLWNGISINSVGNGQTDFNAIAAFTADEISIISGGNSVESGSGAIGGVVRLTNVLEFNKKNQGTIFSSYGSYNTLSSYVKYALSQKKWAVKFTVSHNTSDNDYEYIDDRYKDENEKSIKNLNGNYDNTGVNISLGYKFKPNNKLYFYTNQYKGTRLFSAGLPNPKAGSEKYVNINSQNLLKWKFNQNGYHFTFKSAYLTQEYRYFSHKNNSDFDFGKSEQVSVIYDIEKYFSRYLNINTQVGYGFIAGENHNIGVKKRQNYHQSIHVKSEPFTSLKTSLSIRNEESSFYSLPIVYAFGVDYKLLKYFSIKGNYSTNYRQPTNNELYWPVVGNLNLLPETSKQYDIGLLFINKNIDFSVNYFSIDLKNKILWLPTGSGNLWRPKNVFSVLNQGVEACFKSVYNIKKLKITTLLNYTYVSSLNQVSKKFIPFVPNHTLNYNVSGSYGAVSVYFQQLFQSKVYTLEEQIDFYSLDKLTVSNLGAEFKVLNRDVQKLVLGAKVNNLFNTVYYFTNLRPMPGRNFSININYNF